MHLEICKEMHFCFLKILSFYQNLFPYLSVENVEEFSKNTKRLKQRAGGFFCLNLINDQLDAQFFYFIIRLLQSSTCFEQRRAHHQEVKLY